MPFMGQVTCDDFYRQARPVCDLEVLHAASDNQRMLFASLQQLCRLCAAGGLATATGSKQVNCLVVILIMCAVARQLHWRAVQPCT
jgi:hypothetical protein